MEIQRIDGNSLIDLAALLVEAGVTPPSVPAARIVKKWGKKEIFLQFEKQLRYYLTLKHGIKYADWKFDITDEFEFRNFGQYVSGADVNEVGLMNIAAKLPENT